MTIKKVIMGFVAACLLGAFAYGAVLNYQLLQTFKQGVQDVTYERSDVLQQLFSYGVVQNADPESGTVTFLTQSYGGERTITVHVTSRTAINRQTLITDTRGVVTAISTLTPGTIIDLVTGTRVAVSFKRNGDVVEAIDILFGDPL
jgi:hypothetical protein